MKQSYDEYADSDEDQHDAYLERMKEEGKIREENANDSSDGSGEETGGCRGWGGRRGHPGGLSPGLFPLWLHPCPAPGQDQSPERSHPHPVLSFQMSPSTLSKRTMTWLKSE